MTHAAPSTSPSSPDRDLYCPQCAYNLRGVDSALCPECGAPVNRANLAQSRLPWAQRKRLGWFRAYWRTVRADNHVLLAELETDVSLSEARRFWLITALHAWMPFAMAIVVLGFSHPSPYQGGVIPNMMLPTLLLDFGAAFWPVAIVGIGLFLWIAASTGAASYFCHPAHLPLERQEKSVALAYYTCGALAYLGPGSIAIAFMAWVAAKLHSTSDLTDVAWIGGIFTLIVALLAYLRTIRIITILRQPQNRRRFIVGLSIALPLIWAVFFVLLGLALPAMIIYAILFAMSPK